MAGAAAKSTALAQGANATLVAPPAHVACAQEITAYVTFNAGTGAGQVLVESAPRPDYGGTWATLSTVNWAAASRTHVVQVTGCHGALRLRETGALSGGTVDLHILIKQ